MSFLHMYVRHLHACRPGFGMCIRHVQCDLADLVLYFEERTKTTEQNSLLNFQLEEKRDNWGI